MLPPAPPSPPWSPNPPQPAQSATAHIDKPTLSFMRSSCVREEWSAYGDTLSRPGAAHQRRPPGLAFPEIGPKKYESGGALTAPNQPHHDRAHLPHLRHRALGRHL